MEHATQVLRTQPRKPAEGLEACLKACFDCAAACTACADACLHETPDMLRNLVKCIDLDLDCAGICGATGRRIARAGGADPAVMRTQLQACVASCKASACCMGRQIGRIEPEPYSRSFDADVLRAAKLQHAVQRFVGHNHLGVLTSVGLRPQAITNDALISRDVECHESAEVVSRCSLSAHATTLGDALQMSVPLRRGGLSRAARYCARARRDDNVGSRMPRRDPGIDVVPVVDTIAGKK